MKRRTFISTVAASTTTVIAGCGELASEDADTPSSDSVFTPTKTQSPSGYTPSQKITQAMKTARVELNKAFEEIRSTDFVMSNGVLAYQPKKFERFDPSMAKNHASSAQDALGTAEGAHEGTETRKRVRALKAVALIARKGARLYEVIGQTFDHVDAMFYYEDRMMRSKIVDALRKASADLSKWQEPKREVEAGLVSLRNLPLDPAVERFDFDTWLRVNKGAESLPPELGPTFDGWRAYYESSLHTTAGRKALIDGDADSALAAFEKAIDSVSDARKSLGKALARKARFYRDSVDAYNCRAIQAKEAYYTYREAANAQANGDDQRVKKLREKAGEQWGNVYSECPLPE